MQFALLTAVAFYVCEEDLSDSKVADSTRAVVVVACVHPQYLRIEACVSDVTTSS